VGVPASPARLNITIRLKFVSEHLIALNMEIRNGDYKAFRPCRVGVDLDQSNAESYRPLTAGQWTHGLANASSEIGQVQVFVQAFIPVRHMIGEIPTNTQKKRKAYSRKTGTGSAQHRRAYQIEYCFRSRAAVKPERRRRIVDVPKVANRIILPSQFSVLMAGCQSLMLE
jgi:hypothetical protein